MSCADHFAPGGLNKLVLKLITLVEDVRQTQRLHTTMLQGVTKIISNAPEPHTEQLEPMKFPVSSLEDLDDLEQKLKSTASQKQLVSVS